MSDVLNEPFRKYILKSMEDNSHFWFPKYRIEKFLNSYEFIEFILYDNRLKYETVCKRLHLKSIKKECEQILIILNPLLKETGCEYGMNVKSITCSDLYPILSDDEKYNELKELITTYVKEFSDAGFFYYNMRRCLINNDMVAYQALVDKSASTFYHNNHDSLSVTLRSHIESAQYRLLKLHSWLLLFIDVDYLFISDKHLKIVTRNLLDQIQNHNITHFL